MSVSLEVQVFLGHVIPEGCERVIYDPVKADHMVWDNDIRGYRRPYAGEIGYGLRRFLCVVREKR